ncbi:Ku protein, partial [Streptomyces sp. SB3404]|nr:Ku protein [Streptomyces boncukensis]
VDLMAVLERSVEEARGERSGQATVHELSDRPAKKSTAKKSTAKKVTAKKTTAKKTTAKKATKPRKTA